MDEEEMEPIFRAVNGGDVNEVARLLDAEPHLMEARDPRSYDRTPLIMAAGRGHVGVVRLLLERGADVNAADSFGDTALHEAAGEGHEEVVSILFSHGADPGKKDDCSVTALMSASWRGHLGVARQLLQARECGLDERDFEGSTALGWACHRGDLEVARALLLAGADHTIADDNGWTPRQIAEERGSTDYVALLEWWERELERGYVVHRARCLAEQHSLLQLAVDTAAASLASVSILAFLSPRIPVIPPLPHVEVVRLSEDVEPGAPTCLGKGEVEEEGGGDVQGPSEAERDATVKYVMQDLHPELYIELMAGFHPIRASAQQADDEDGW